MFVKKLKTMLYTGALALVPAALFVMTPSHANAYTLQQQTNVPFAFKFGNRTLPAGNYRLKPVFESTNLSYYLVNTDTGRTVMVSRSFGAGETPVELIFTKDADGYTLKQVR